jgi:hypothetical protein
MQGLGFHFGDNATRHVTRAATVTTDEADVAIALKFLQRRAVASIAAICLITRKRN